jgi:hypothetical protein
MAMDSIKILDLEVDEINGFCWVKTEHGLLQACLKRVDQVGENYKYISAIEKKEWAGMLDGLCGDANDKMFEKFGARECIDWFFSSIEEHS